MLPLSCLFVGEYVFIPCGPQNIVTILNVGTGEVSCLGLSCINQAMAIHGIETALEQLKIAYGEGAERVLLISMAMSYL